MSSHRTSILDLHTWEATDGVVREEFNHNFSAIENAFANITDYAGNLRMSTGIYTGDGSTTKTITFTELPDLFLVVSTGTGSLQPGMLIGCPAFGIASHPKGYTFILTKSGSACTWEESSSAGAMNRSGVTYCYFAFKLV